MDQGSGPTAAVSDYGSFIPHPHVVQEDLSDQWQQDGYWQERADRGLAAERSSIDDEDLSECVRTWEALPRGPEAGSPRAAALVHLQLSRVSRSGSASDKAFASGDAGPVLCLNVGGSVFRATEATLRKAPFFESLLRHAQGGALGTTMDSSGRFFVDRSGDLFAYILEYLRCGHWLLGPRASDPDFVVALREEAGFYGLDLVAGVLPLPRISEYVTVWQFRDDSSLYVDCLEQTIREDPDHQGLFRLCKYSGGLPLDQQTCTRRFKATSHSVQSVIAYFAMRGFRLQHVVQGSVITHVTSADGQSRNGPAVQFLLCRLTSFPSSRTPPNSHRNLA